MVLASQKGTVESVARSSRTVSATVPTAPAATEPDPLGAAGAPHRKAVGAWSTPVGPGPPAVRGEGDEDDLQTGVGVQAGLGEQQDEEDVVGDADGPVGDVLTGDEPDAERSTAESEDLGPAHRRCRAA